MTTPQTTRNPLVPLGIMLGYFVDYLLGTSRRSRTRVAVGFAVVVITLIALLLGATLLTTFAINTAFGP